ncbi:hypothetical protein QTG54_016168 [Skeletonema marinoi]|uniref:RING-type domain-containing protein n=1 Tax=Skeletonema marinoi TaxID=267567 RepID=A0AAD8XST6_9STRA|nr:hypothetical protein QTG54_016168 [Skeletonema marinoi]
MASNTAAPPVTLHPDNLPDDLVCSICLTVPADPLITPCDHVFCKPCIRQALNVRNVCPIDRRPCTVGQLKRLEGLSLRVWSGIQVKCGGHESGCAWRGSIADYATHVENNCNVGRNPVGNNVDVNLELTEEVDALRRENLEMKEQLEESRRANRMRDVLLREAVVTATDRTCDHFAPIIEQLGRERDSLRQSRDALRENLNNRPNLPRIFYGDYYFGREEVTELSQLISRYLDEAPIEIDSNKIFNCVRTCYIALDKHYVDNPDTYWYDMRMLLGTCLASGWFTDNQWNNIDSWYRKHFGNVNGP